MTNECLIAKLKSEILSGATVELSDKVLETHKPVFDNHHHTAWIFVKLSNNCHVRLTVLDSKNKINSKFILESNDDGYILLDKSKGTIIANILEIEEEAVHAPNQLFLGIYEYCKVGCVFCPLSQDVNNHIHYSLDDIYKDIDDNFEKYSSIGITTSIPLNLSPEDVADEMIFITSKIREKVGSKIPIGVSTKIPSVEHIRRMKNAGADEIRLNYEVANPKLAKILMPNKKQKDILEALRLSVDTFGINKVSSNIVIGLGESDDDVIKAVELLASIGVIPTLYPYDAIESSNTLTKTFVRPSAERLFNLAIAHKSILEKYSLIPQKLKTMCPACAASHIFPGRDL